jgi:hypothetical protein
MAKSAIHALDATAHTPLRFLRLHFFPEPATGQPIPNHQKLVLALTQKTQLAVPRYRELDVPHIRRHRLPHEKMAALQQCRKLRKHQDLVNSQPTKVI